MKEKTNRLDVLKDVPLIGQEAIKDLNVNYDGKRVYNRKISILKKIYFSAVAVAFIITVIIIAFRSAMYDDNFLVENTSDSWESSAAATSTGTEITIDLSVIVPEDTSIQIEVPKDTKEENVVDLYDIYTFDYSLVPNKEYPIIPVDLSMSLNGDGYVNNKTGYLLDISSLLNKELKNEKYEFLSASNQPVVLIMHSHGSEAYSKVGAISYSENKDVLARSADTKENVVAVGKIVADTLIKNGIPTVHCPILHDSIEIKDSYIRSEETIKEYLKKYVFIVQLPSCA